MTLESLAKDPESLTNDTPDIDERPAISHSESATYLFMGDVDERRMTTLNGLQFGLAAPILRFGGAVRRHERFGEDMYLPLIAFAIFASILFGIGLVAGRAADRIT